MKQQSTTADGLQTTIKAKGGSRVSGKGVHINKGMGACIAEFISFVRKYPMEMKYVWLTETKLFPQDI